MSIYSCSSSGGSSSETASNFQLESLNHDSLSKIFSYLSGRDLSSLSCVSRTMNSAVDHETDQRLQRLKNHPLLRFIADRISSPGAIRYYRRIYEVLHASKVFSELLAVKTYYISRYQQVPYLLDLSTIAREIENKLNHEVENRSPFNPKMAYNHSQFLKELSKLADHCGGYSALFLAAYAQGEGDLFKAFDLAMVQTEVIDLVLYVALFKKDADTFNQLLRYSSFYSGDQKRQEGLMNVLIELSIRTDQKAVFDMLIGLGFPFSPNETLVSLVRMNRAEWIAGFLASNPLLHTDFIPGLERFHYRDGSHWSGLHSALMTAANLGNREALNAILQAFPNTIERNLLEHVRDVLQNHEPVRDARLNRMDWEDRENNPRREEIIQILNHELETRDFPLPPIHLDEFEAALPAGPAPIGNDGPGVDGGMVLLAVIAALLWSIALAAIYTNPHNADT